MTDAEVIEQLRGDNESLKRARFNENCVHAHDRKRSEIAIFFLVVLSFVSLGAGRWQGHRDLRDDPAAVASVVCPRVECPSCAPVPRKCVDSVVELGGWYAVDGRHFCEFPEQLMNVLPGGQKALCACPVRSGSSQGSEHNGPNRPGAS